MKIALIIAAIILIALAVIATAFVLLCAGAAKIDEIEDEEEKINE